MNKVFVQAQQFEYDFYDKSFDAFQPRILCLSPEDAKKEVIALDWLLIEEEEKLWVGFYNPEKFKKQGRITQPFLKKLIKYQKKEKKFYIGKEVFDHVFLSIGREEEWDGKTSKMQEFIDALGINFDPGIQKGVKRPQEYLTHKDLTIRRFAKEVIGNLPSISGGI